MDVAAICMKADALFAEAPFVSQIDNETDYGNALALMDALIDDYGANRSLIGVLAVAIERWEQSAKEFASFNARVGALNDDVAVLSVLQDQYALNTSDLEPLCGGRAALAQILAGRRRLTRMEIQGLSDRFGLAPAVFFPKAGQG